MSSDLTAEQIEARKKRTFKKFTYRGLDLEDLLRKTLEEVRNGGISPSLATSWRKGVGPLLLLLGHYADASFALCCLFRLSRLHFSAGSHLSHLLCA